MAKKLKKIEQEEEERMILKEQVHLRNAGNSAEKTGSDVFTRNYEEAIKRKYKQEHIEECTEKLKLVQDERERDTDRNKLNDKKLSSRVHYEKKASNNSESFKENILPLMNKQSFSQNQQGLQNQSIHNNQLLQSQQDTENMPTPNQFLKDDALTPIENANLSLEDDAIEDIESSAKLANKSKVKDESSIINFDSYNDKSSVMKPSKSKTKLGISDVDGADEVNIKIIFI